MKVPAPSWIYDIEDEGHRLFVAFAYRVSLLEGFNTAYYIHSHDINIIMGSYGMEDISMAYLYPKFQLANCGYPAYRFYFKGQPNETQYELESERARIVWAYLMGYIADFGSYVTTKRKPGDLGHPKIKCNYDEIEMFRGKARQKWTTLH